MSACRSLRVCAVAALVTILHAWGPSPRVAAAPQAGLPDPGLRKPGPILTISTLAGDMRVDRLRGKVVLVDFMTTVCPACKQASAGIQKVYAQLGTRGFHPVAVALNETSPPSLGSYALLLGLTFCLATTPRAEALRYLQHPPDRPFLVPTLVLLDRQGRICSVDVGWSGEDMLRTRVLALLSESEHPEQERGQPER